MLQTSTATIARPTFRTRENLPAIHAQEELINPGFSFEELVAYAEGTGVCTAQDLLDQGARVFEDMVLFAAGRIPGVELPKQLPERGAYRV